MTTNKMKEGISLIVLVITVIIMIILAAVIILSLNNSGIIANAKEAREKSDIANKRVVAEAILAEYELGKDLNSPNETATEYVKRKLEEQGIDSSDVAVTEDKKVVIGNAANANSKRIKDRRLRSIYASSGNEYKV